MMDITSLYWCTNKNMLISIWDLWWVVQQFLRPKFVYFGWILSLYGYGRCLDSLGAPRGISVGSSRGSTFPQHRYGKLPLICDLPIRSFWFPYMSIALLNCPKGNMSWISQKLFLWVHSSPAVAKRNTLKRCPLNSCSFRSGHKRGWFPISRNHQTWWKKWNSTSRHAEL